MKTLKIGTITGWSFNGIDTFSLGVKYLNQRLLCISEQGHILLLDETYGLYNTGKVYKGMAEINEKSLKKLPSSEVSRIHASLY